MNSIFPFIFNNLNIFSQLFNNIFLEGAVNQMISNNLANHSIGEEAYEIEFKDCGDYYLIKGYLPHVSSRDIRIDFQKNMVILTIRRNQVYKNESMMMTMVLQTSGNIVKTFYVEEIDKNKIGAAFEKNILLLTLPKKKYIDIYTEEKQTIIDVDNYIEAEKV